MSVRLPEVVPVMTKRPPGFRLRRFWSQTAAPTTSNTMSTATAAGQLHHTLAEVGGVVVVDDLVGPQLFGPLQLPVATCGGDDPRPDVLGNLYAGAAHATASSLNQDVLPRLKLVPGHHAMPSGVAGDGQGRQLVRRSCRRRNGRR